MPVHYPMWRCKCVWSTSITAVRCTDDMVLASLVQKLIKTKSNCEFPCEKLFFLFTFSDTEFSTLVMSKLPQNPAEYFISWLSTSDVRTWSLSHLLLRPTMWITSWPQGQDNIRSWRRILSFTLLTKRALSHSQQLSRSSSTLSADYCYIGLARHLGIAAGPKV